MSNRAVFMIIIVSLIGLIVLASVSPSQERPGDARVKQQVKIVKEKTLSILDYIGLGAAIALGTIFIGSFYKWTKS